MPDTPPHGANALKDARSAYLRSAAHQPVQWRQFTAETLAEAETQDKPILLDIGAVWCHWCHVIDRESYEDPDIAAIINDLYIPVKVDRDERPDLDHRYQLAVSALTGRGGWPLTAFLTPEGKVFYGGTYFPKDDRMGMRGMRSLLPRVAEMYHSQKPQIHASANQLQDELAKHAHNATRSGPLDAGLEEAFLSAMIRDYEPRYGGFSQAPKFPAASAIDFLINYAARTGDDQTGQIVTHTLTEMGLGGVYDQLGGGFHRYSVDPYWRVPHFEKMLYGQTEGLLNYLHAYQLTGDGFYRYIAEGIIDYVNAVLSDQAQGGFYASQDADITLEDDGDYFTWTLDEALEVLTPDEAKVMLPYYNIERIGEMHENPAKNVLFVAYSPEEISKLTGLDVEHVIARLRSGVENMKAARAQRRAPFVDTSLLTCWNGHAVRAYLEAYRVLGRTDCRDFALKTADLFLSKAYEPGQGVAHVLAGNEPRIWGLLDDQVSMALAFTEAYEISGDAKYLAAAEDVMAYCDRAFRDAAEGGYFDIEDQPGAMAPLTIRHKPIQDAPTPAANAVAVLALDRLAVLTGKPAYRERAEQTLSAFGAVAPALGTHGGTYALALDLHRQGLPHIVIVGAGSEADALRDTAFQILVPGKVVQVIDPAASSTMALPDILAGPVRAAGAGPEAFVCTGDRCLPPVTDPVALAQTMAEALGLKSITITGLGGHLHVV